jgi:hypothetical protein
MNFKLLLLVFTIIFLNACTSSQSSSQITPIPSPELLSLPADGLVHCFNDPNLDDRGGAIVWELPGLPSRDPNSNVGGNTGRALGVVKNCSTVTVTDYVWSEADYEFYVYIKTENPENIVEADLKKLEGWVPFHLVDLSP